jgi:PIN domain nuclease of toxin-antitoxin system
VAIYVTDTHPLIWYSTETYRKLSPKVRRAFDRAGRSEVLIWIPSMAIWEAGLLHKIGRVRFKPSFEHWIDSVVAQPGYAFAPLDLDLITSALEIVPHADLFDTGIVATARQKAAPLITRDELITERASVEIYW